MKVLLPLTIVLGSTAAQIAELTLRMNTQPHQNSIFTISPKECPDPYVLLHNGIYFMTYTSGSHIELWSSESLLNPKWRVKKIWQPPEEKTPYSAEIWAPELHLVDGKWYIYFAADHPDLGNKSHRMYVLEGPKANDDLMDHKNWKFHGALAGMRKDQWAIDGTVITLHGNRYFVYSGWPMGVEEKDAKQEIFIIKMESPIKCNGEPIVISTPIHPFEHSVLHGSERGINEGPQFLSSPNGEWKGIVYSCGGSWSTEYKMNVLHYKGEVADDVMRDTSWIKSDHPLLQASSDGTPPYAPGHGNFVLVNNPKDLGICGVFHATDGKTGWAGRKARLMPVKWTEQGPVMGNGECGSCCSDSDKFLKACAGNSCSSSGPEHEEGVSGSHSHSPALDSQGGVHATNIKQTVRELASDGKKLLHRVFK